MTTRMFVLGVAAAAVTATISLGVGVSPASAAGTARLPATCGAGLTLSRGSGSVDVLSVSSRGVATSRDETFRTPVRAIVEMVGPTGTGRLVVDTSGVGTYQDENERGRYVSTGRVGGSWASTRLVFSPYWGDGDFDHPDLYAITSAGTLVRYPTAPKGATGLSVGRPATIAKGYGGITAIAHAWWDAKGRQYYWATDSTGRLLEIGLTPGARPVPAIRVLAASGFRGVTAIGLGGCGDEDDPRMVVLTRTAKGEVMAYVDRIYGDHSFRGTARYDVGEAGTQRWRNVL